MTNREIDALVAEKIMGRKKTARYCYDEKIEILLPESHIKSGFVDIPHYSTDISAAWEVVEKMREKEFAFSIATVKHMANPIRYEWIAKFEFFRNQGEYCFEFEFNENEATAICLAALKALGIDASEGKGRE